jgi:geranylgeranyl diphosphate synthase, type II
MDIKAYLAEKKSLVEKALEQQMPPSADLLVDHVEAMRYSLFAGGKRVRPILCIAAAEALNGIPGPLMPIACAFECIHTYSLIHDDLPAMDNDDLRRGKPTSHKVFGEAGAILAGDGLLTYAFELLSDPALKSHIENRQLLRIINIVARAAGSFGMVGGQALDLAAEGKQVDFEALREIHSRKTGALITAAVQAGAVIGGANDEQFAALTAYGEKIGLAFQIVDDLLNVVGTAEELGKAAGSDAHRQKATYPAFFGLDATRARAENVVREAIDSLSTFNAQADPLRELARYIYIRTT